jgi:predicted RNA-binding protein with PUA-like domain
MTTQYWLMKSEPDVYPWSRLVADGRGHWDGVRNHQAARNLRDMRCGDRAFFYHSNIGKEIVGTMTVARTWYPDHTDPTGKWGMVDVAPLASASTPLSLGEIKVDPALADMVLLRQSRLSVGPVTPEAWAHICRRLGIDA